MKRHRETWHPFGRTTLPMLVVGACLWSTACDETPTAANPDPPAPQFKKGGGKPPPPNLRGTPLDAMFRDAPGDRLRSDRRGTNDGTEDCDGDLDLAPDSNCYRSGEDSDGDGTADTFVLLFDSGGIEVRLDQGGVRRFLVGPFADVECGGTPCTGKGLIGAFTLWEDSDGDGVGDQELEGRFLDVTDANSGLITAEMTAAWEAGNYRWHLKYGQDCNYDAVIANRLTVTVLPSPAGEIAGWAVETTGEEKAFLCRIPQRGKRVAELIDQFIAPVRLEFRYQPNP